MLSELFIQLQDWGDRLTEDAQLRFYADLSIADTPKLPAWNPGDEFEAARRKALGEVRKGGR